MSQTGKVALVTGAGQGIGKAIVESLLREGASVTLSDINKEIGISAVEEFSQKFGDRIFFYQCDVSVEKQLEDCFKATIDRFSRLDIVVNNAGIANEDLVGWRNLIGINLIGVIHSCKLALDYMGVENGGNGGVIVNVGSIAVQEPWPWNPVYAATKAGINHYSRALGHDLHFKKTGVKVFTINPGWTTTPLMKTLPTNETVSDDLSKFFAKHIEQSPEDVGSGLIYLLEHAESGSWWTIEDKKPPVRTTNRED